MQKTKIKILIEGKISALLVLQKEAQEGCDTVALDQTRVGRLSRMDAMQQQAMNQAAQQRRGLELNRLRIALQRIDEEDSEYGYCEECGEVISEGRLLFDPAVEYCIGCAQRQEKS